MQAPKTIAYNNLISIMLQAYPMTKKERGQAFIFNVQTVRGYEDRTGTDVDRNHLQELFTQLHFNVVVYNNSDGLTASVICVARPTMSLNTPPGDLYVKQNKLIRSKES